MCMIVKKNESSEILIKMATKNIKVYKRMRKDGTTLVSPYRGCGWDKNRLYYSHISIDNGGSIEQAFHAYTTAARAIKEKIYHNEVIAVMIIPKGAYYCRGKYFEIAGSRMLWTGEIVK